jgi:glycerate 2-kinase
MKIVIAPDSFKGSLSAMQVACAIEAGIKNINENIQTILLPMADGGEGTVQTLIDATGGSLVELFVHDPLFRKVKSFYGIMGDGKTAVIEMAAASGLTLLTLNERNPLVATTYGAGELIKDALDKGCKKFIIGLGGSATNDGGCGMASALGVKFLDENNNEIGFGGIELQKLKRIDLSGLDPRIKEVSFTCACDVENILCGNSGASKVYGKQKGATPEDVILLDNALLNFANIVQKQYGLDIANVKGAGAAGGLGAGVLFFLQASLQKGIDIIINATRLEEKLQGALLVITGEGRLDEQTAFGKTPFGVATVASKKNIPVIALAGSLGNGYQSLYEKGFTGIFSIINKPMPLQEAIDNAALLLKESAENIVRLFINKQQFNN